jgi:hypothetical protein
VTDEIVAIVRPSQHLVEVTVRRGARLTRYKLTEVPTRVVPVLEYEKDFHTDFSGNEDVDARMLMFDVVWRVLRGDEINLPIALPVTPSETPDSWS